jgi:hypothetical protein
MVNMVVEYAVNPAGAGEMGVAPALAAAAAAVAAPSATISHHHQPPPSATISHHQPPPSATISHHQPPPSATTISHHQPPPSATTTTISHHQPPPPPPPLVQAVDEQGKTCSVRLKDSGETVAANYEALRNVAPVKSDKVVVTFGGDREKTGNLIGIDEQDGNFLLLRFASSLSPVF